MCVLEMKHLMGFFCSHVGAHRVTVNMGEIALSRGARFTATAPARATAERPATAVRLLQYQTIYTQYCHYLEYKTGELSFFVLVNS